MQRRRFLQVAAGAGALAGLGLLAGRTALHRFARPAPADGPLSADAQALLDRAWAGLDPKKVLDVHAHVVGLGLGGTGAYVHPRMRQPFAHPVDWARFSIYCAAAGIDDFDRADEQYLEVLTRSVRGQQRHGRHVLLPFDQVYLADGSCAPELTEFHAPNEYVQRIAKDAPDCYVAAASIHPYRKDAVAALEQQVQQGAVLVKWLPNAMHIDPASPLCDPFYDALARLGIPLLSHAGEERAVGAHSQSFGNPLLLRRALDRGVKVIVAHCASLGSSEDLDAPGMTKPLVRDFDLFLRLATDGRYRDRVWGDISATTQENRCGVLTDLLRNEALHARLVYGTDYPLAAINGLIRTGPIAERGLITKAERALLNELDRHNPLAFDLALKRSLRLVEGGKSLRLPEHVFHLRPELFPTLA